MAPVKKPPSAEQIEDQRKDLDDQDIFALPKNEAPTESKKQRQARKNEIIHIYKRLVRRV